MIQHKTARRIACEWHGGGGSALYALCSTGAIDTARNDHSAAAEITGDLQWIYEKLQMSDGRRRRDLVNDERDLHGLAGYVSAHGPREPIAGWGDMP